MAGRIPEQFIDDVVARTDLVELISSRLKLKKSGSNHMGLCPFHNEKSPSFSVSESKQLYHCFGCGASGNALTFLIEHDRLDFVEAIETLASSIGMEVPREEQSAQSKEIYLKKKQEQQALFDLMEKANEYFQQQLRQHPTKLKAVNYLKNRGMTGHTAKAFQLGFAPAGWDNLLKALGKDTETRKLLATAGLLAEKEQKPDDYYDRFRDRVIFPILDTSGRTIAFGGRVLAKDEKPKYYNSPETPIFHKSQTLYGLYQARQKDRHPQQLIVVEGYMDVIALAQHNIHNAVACLGTALTEEHVRLLFKQTSQIIFCFDGDTAGRKAARKALELSLSQLIDGREAKFLFLDEGEDPDTLVSKGGQQAFIDATKEASSVDQFLFSLFDNSDSLEGKAKLAKEAMPLIQQVPGSFIKNLLIQELARKTGLNEYTLNQQNTATNNTTNKTTFKKPATPKTATTHSQSTFASTPELPPSHFDSIPDEAYFGEFESSEVHYHPEFDTQSEHTAFTRNPQSKASSNSLAMNALRLVIHAPELAKNLPDSALQLNTERSDESLLNEIIHYLKKQSNTLNTANLIGYFQDSTDFHLLKTALENPPHTENIDLQSQLKGYLDKLQTKQQQDKMFAIKEKIHNKTATKEEIRLFFQEQQKVKNSNKKK
jgi:DNA primase